MHAHPCAVALVSVSPTQADRARERAAYWSAYWSTRGGASGGASCNSSADCSWNGDCRPTNWTRQSAVALSGTSATLTPAESSTAATATATSEENRGDSTAGSHAATLSGAPAWPRHACVCHEGFRGARCSHAPAPSSGGAQCNATLPCGGEGSRCVSGRCQCGNGWLGARCNFAGLAALASIVGGGACNTTRDCMAPEDGSSDTGSRCIASSAHGKADDRHSEVKAARVDTSWQGQCRCGPGQLGAHCRLSAFGNLPVGGGTCNTSTECKPPRTASQLSPPGGHLKGNGSVDDAGGGSRCDTHAGKCICAAGAAGTHCEYSLDLLMRAARTRAQREQARAKELHLCLSAWRGVESTAATSDDPDSASRDARTAEGIAEAGQRGNVKGRRGGGRTRSRRRALVRAKGGQLSSGSGKGRRGAGESTGEAPLLADGTPLVFALCRQRLNSHQRFDQVQTTEHESWTSKAGNVRAGGDYPRAGTFRLQLEAAPQLCVTVPPLFLAGRDHALGRYNEDSYSSIPDPIM